MVLTNIIKFIGLNELGDKDKETIIRVIDHDYEKTHSALKKATAIVFHIKVLAKGKAKKYSIHIRAEVPTKLITAKAVDWDIARATHKAMDKINGEMDHLSKRKLGDKLKFKQRLKTISRLKDIFKL
jgi:hypothetical protein